jgi:hypothetical protein
MFEFKSKIPDFERGKAIRLRRINHPAEIQRDRHPYIEYFEDSAEG